MNRHLILIPSSRFVDSEMQTEVGAIPPVLIPVNGRPLLESIIESFAQLPGEKVFAVTACEGIELLRDYLYRIEAQNRPFWKSIKLIEVSAQADLGGTIVHALEQLNLKDFSDLLINFGDTLVESDFDFSKDAIFYQDLNESYRWTTFQGDKQIVYVTDKFMSDVADWNHVFTGLFYFTDIQLFLNSLKKAESSYQVGRFYTGLCDYLGKQPYRIEKVKNWYDFGHVDNFYQSKKIFVNRRFFNQVEIHPRHAVLKKKSANVKKFAGEISWYLKLPATLKHFTPQIFSHSLDPQEMFIEMEYYGYPTVADLYLLGGHSLGIWNHVFDAIFDAIEDMRSHPVVSPPDIIEDTLEEIYIDKTLARLEQLRFDLNFRPLFDGPISINGNQFPSLSEVCKIIPTLCRGVLCENAPSFSVIHGDLCIANILFDPKSRIIKLIDPRGEFGQFAVHGDFRYELAKLSHSFRGHYESVISDNFYARGDGAKIEYHVFLTDAQQTVTKMFTKRLEKTYPEHSNAIMLIEALLFLSMVPLHSDFPERQRAMLAIGLEQLQRFREKHST